MKADMNRHPDYALDARDVAQMLGVSANLVYKLAKEGRLPSYRVGRKLRFTADDVEAYMRTGSTENAAVHDAAFLNEATRPRRGASFVLAGRGIVADVLGDYLDGFGLNVTREFRDGYAGLIALYLGFADAAVISLWDGASGICNIPYIQRLMPGTPCVVYALGKMSFGLIVKQGNPKRIRRWSHLLHDDIVIANRELGCPQRILLDEQLCQLEASPSTIKGYDRILFSELALGDFVMRGGADTGVATEDLFHRVAGIDYLPLCNQDLALVVRKTPETMRVISFIANLLQSKNYQELLVNAPGLNISGMGNPIYET